MGRNARFTVHRIDKLAIRNRLGQNLGRALARRADRLAPGHFELFSGSSILHQGIRATGQRPVRNGSRRRQIVTDAFQALGRLQLLIEGDNGNALALRSNGTLITVVILERVQLTRR